MTAGQRTSDVVVAHQALGSAEHVGESQDGQDCTTDNVDSEEGGDTPQEAVGDPDDDGDDRESHHTDHDHAVTGDMISTTTSSKRSVRPPIFTIAQNKSNDAPVFVVFSPGRCNLQAC